VFLLLPEVTGAG